MEQQRYDHFKCNDFILDDDFRAWVSGKTPEKNHLWDAWLQARPYSRVEVEKARKIIHSLHFKTRKISDSDVALQWEKLELAILNKDSQSEAEVMLPRKRRFPFLYFLAAASVLAILSFGIHRFLFSSPQKLVLAQVEQKTTNGQQLRITLPDGTLVTLNAGSVLSYPRQFEEEIREVSLIGEAFFDVVRNENAPFVIHTGDVTTRVLGTSFNIRAYPENEEVQVAVVQGKVSVRAGGISSEDKKNSVNLTESEMATFQKAQGELTVSDYDAREQIGWKDGILYFEKTDFISAIRKLERCYGVTIRISEGRKMDPTWRFSGRFKNKSVDYILGVMSYPNQFSFKIKNNIINLK